MKLDRLEFEIIFLERMKLKKKGQFIFSENPQREQSMELPSSLKGTVNPSLVHFGHLVNPLNFYPKPSGGHDLQCE